MPIYEYQCTVCQHQFDLIQKMNDEPVKLCPHCAKNTVIRLVSAAGFQLKGTGWYVTDFKDKGKPKSNSTETAGSTETKTASESKSSETKVGD